MNKHFYLFVFDNDEMCEIIDTASFKTAIWEVAEYWGENSDLFQKSLKGFEETDVDGIIKLCNHFCQTTIVKVYEIQSAIWEEEKK